MAGERQGLALVRSADRYSCINQLHDHRTRCVPGLLLIRIVAKNPIKRAILRMFERDGPGATLLNP